MANTERRNALIVNGTAGTGTNAERMARIEPEIVSMGYDVLHTSPDLAETNFSVYNTIVVYGGDGTFYRLLNLSNGSQVCIPLPGGSQNVAAGYYGWKDVTKSLPPEEQLLGSLRAINAGMYAVEEHQPGGFVEEVSRYGTQESISHFHWMYGNGALFELLRMIEKVRSSEKDLRSLLGGIEVLRSVLQNMYEVEVIVPGGRTIRAYDAGILRVPQLADIRFPSEEQQLVYLGDKNNPQMSIAGVMARAMLAFATKRSRILVDLWNSVPLGREPVMFTQHTGRDLSMGRHPMVVDSELVEGPQRVTVNPRMEHGTVFIGRYRGNSLQ